MPNEGEAARAYHELTKHSTASVRSSGHRLLWEIQPLPFKIYSQLAPLPLPRRLPGCEMPALDAMAATTPEVSSALDVGVLARLLYACAGITKERVYGDRRVYFRAAPCTGALYHIDVYVACGALHARAGADDGSDLAPGVYHFGPHDFALRRLRDGDHRGALVAATASEPSVTRAAAVLVFASTFWRNAWKYQARAYRHCWWDGGTMLAQLLAAAAAQRVSAKTVMGFVDADVHRLLGLDDAREGALFMVALGDDPRAPDAPSQGELAPIAHETLALSSREIDYPAIREIHAASSLPDAASVARWRERGRSSGAAPSPSPVGEPLEIAGLAAPSATSLDVTIAKRGSTRRFARAPIEAAALGSMLGSSLVPLVTDARGTAAPASDAVYLIANAVDGLEAGSYVLERAHASGCSLASLRRGSFRNEAGYLGLGQDIPADAAANVYFLADLERQLDVYGARGYRLAQLEAAVHGGRVYLAAYALGLGASGLTFFDDDVTAFFSPHAAGKSVMFLIAVGAAERRSLVAR